MADYVLSCCSTADLSEQYFAERDIHYVCFHFTLNGEQYFDDLGKSMSLTDFYETLKNDPDTDVSTSQVNITEYLAYFEPFLKAGKDIFHVCLSSGISGTCNSAQNAAEIALERYPERKICIVDSLAASAAYGMLVDSLADMRDAGKSMEELKAWAEENRFKLHQLIFTSDLTFFVKGGRISKTAGLFGGMLNICPFIEVNREGKLIPREKIRGKKAVIKHAVKKMTEYVNDGPDYADKCFISNAYCYEDAKETADLVEAAFPNLKGRVLIFDIGTTIGSHTGPGTVSLSFYGKEREEFQ